MPLGNVQYVHLPYCIKRQPDATYIVLNREYLPLGFKTRQDLDRAGHPTGVKLPGLRAATAVKISCKSSTDLSTIYLYDDGCIPTSSSMHMEAYLRRLAHFAKLKVA